MDGDTPLLGVDSRAQHFSRAEENTYLSLVHRLDHRLAFLLGLGFLNETYLVFGDAVILHQLALDLAVRIPLVGLVGSQVRENELSAFMPGVFIVILRNHIGAMGGLVVLVVAVGERIDEPHVERHLPGVVGGDEHLRLLFPLVQWRAAQYGGIAGLGELDELLYELPLVGRRGYVVQYLVLFRTVDADVGCGAEVGDLGIERSEFRNLDEVAETLFLHHLVGDGELVIDGLPGKHRRPCVKGVDPLTLQFPGAQVLEEQVQLGQRVGNGGSRQEGGSQVLAGALLDGAQGEEHVERTLAALAVAQTCHTVVPGGEHQVLEPVALIDKEVVDAHALEVRHVVLAGFDLVEQLFQPDLKVHLAFLHALDLCVAHFRTLLVEDFEVLFHTVQFLLQDVTLDFGGLRYHAELLVREDDGVPVVVLHPVENLDTALRREVLLAGIEDFGVRVGGGEGLCDLVDVRLQAGDKGLVRQSQTLHLVGGTAHDERLAATHLVIGDPPSVLLEHPDAVLLAGIQVGNAQPLEVKTGKALVRAVVLGTDEAVELAVVHVRHFPLELRRLFHEPVGEAVTDLVNLAVGKQGNLRITYLHFLARLVQYGLGDVGRGVVDGMAHKGDAVEDAAFRTHRILVHDAWGGHVGLDAVLVVAGGITDGHVRVEQP